ncbi:unnamed protein product [Protopolystoma xenopodis]|uniref:EF-hand domain-containing protein n=1 Tax=Protopolystoma xenopodis TaxID=117903 RepID=A0A3S4ZMK1_9PLAT|nr:unnamed protein product [Protopolystoma xenopodis]
MAQEDVMNVEALDAFLKDLLQLSRLEYDNKAMEHYKDVILKEWDLNRDGLIDKMELKMLLLQQEKLFRVRDRENRFIELNE